jgi:hypothetical protein
MYTHLACGFARGGKVDCRTEQLLRRLASRNGWFVPVCDLLDFLREERKTATIPEREFISMEQQWIHDRVALLGAGALRSVRALFPEANHHVLGY